MDTVDLSAMLERNTYALEVYQGDEMYSTGSAFCWHERGFLMTAAHVVTGRTPIREEDWRDPVLSVLGRTSRGEYARYEVAMCGVTVDFPGPLKGPLQVDLALLRPAEPRSGAEHLTISHERWPPAGTPVLMAGFPDELQTPLRFTESINYEHPPIKAEAEGTRRDVERVEQLLMVKGGIVGHRSEMSIDPDGTGRQKLELAAYYIDNAMHSGASGGPVVDGRGAVLGVITERAVTRVSYPDLDNPNKEVPSGSALAVSAFTALEAAALWGEQSE